MGSEGFPVSAEAIPWIAQHVYRCSFAAPHPIERVALQALHKESAQEGIFLPHGLLQALRPCKPGTKLAFVQRGCLGPPDGYERCQASEGRFPLRRVGPGCLFWIVVSVVLSVTLTILLNALLYLL